MCTLLPTVRLTLGNYVHSYTLLQFFSIIEYIGTSFVYSYIHSVTHKQSKMRHFNITISDKTITITAATQAEAVINILTVNKLHPGSITNITEIFN